MSQPRRLLLLPLLFACASCATTAGGVAGTTETAASPKLYTAEQRKMLMACLSIADIAWVAAQAWKEKAPIDKVKAPYARLEGAKLALLTVDRVYQQRPAEPWSYAVDFFKECAVELAKVPKEKSSGGAYCLQNSMIAGVAYAYRREGAPIERAYAYFAPIQSATPRQIVDRTYARGGERADAMLTEWNSCIAPLSE